MDGFEFADGQSWSYDDIIANLPENKVETPGLEIEGGSGGGHLVGGDGRDVLQGGDGNDILDGGRGDDTLIGGAGDNVYLYRPGDGRDHIYPDRAGHDLLRLLGGLTAEDLIFSRAKSGDGSYDDLLITFRDRPLGGITVRGYFDGNADGLLTGAGGGGNDELDGGQGDDILYGGDGDDVLKGGWGKKYDYYYRYYGECLSGNDLLVGGAGNDTFYFQGGHDVVDAYDENTAKHDALFAGPSYGDGTFEASYRATREFNEATGKYDLIIIDKKTGETMRVLPALSAAGDNSFNSYSLQSINGLTVAQWLTEIGSASLGSLSGGGNTIVEAIYNSDIMV